MNDAPCATRVSQPVPLVLSDMLDDLKKVASSLASKYTDNTCFALNFEDLVGECMAKIPYLVQKCWLTRAKTREEFFKIAKTSMNNHVRGVVQRHRFTIKRTGHKPPERGVHGPVPPKPEISIDDPDIGLQLQNLQSENSGEYDTELIEHLRSILTPIENLVFTQMLSPCSASYLEAGLDARRGLGRKSTLVVNITFAHMAKGLGMDEQLFNRIQHGIKDKYKNLIMNPKPDDVKFNQALAALEEIYQVQVPHSTERVVIARLFTIAARDKLDRFNPDTEKFLKIVGARPPAFDGNSKIECYGVLFSKNHRICLSCGLRQSCELEAANYGLNDITISPKLLGARNARIPTLTDQPIPTASIDTELAAFIPPAQVEPPKEITPAPEENYGGKNLFTRTQQDEEVFHYLKEHFRQIRFADDQGKKEIYYTHKEGKPKCVFLVGTEGEPFVLRFCKPSPELRSQLVQRVRSFYVSEGAPTEQIIKLIDKHADDRLIK